MSVQIPDRRFTELCMACRTGDIENVDRLISMGLNVNNVDEYDNSPLFLASLCGHEEVVKLLLERGAVCDRDKFEGARCIYGALTDSIRDILLSYDISKAVDLNQPFATHISSLLKESGYFRTYDLTIEFSDEQINYKAHKFLLNICCPEFFNRKWLQDNDTIELNSVTDATTFEYFLNYLYLLPTVYNMSHEDYRLLIKFAEITKLPLLVDFLNKSRNTYDPAEKSSLVIDFQFKFREYLRQNLEEFVEEYIIKGYITEKNQTLPSNSVCYKNLAMPDIYLRVENHDDDIRLYPCHLAILERAALFQLMFSYDFLEKSNYDGMGENNETQIQPMTINFPKCQFDVVETVIKYLYYDCTDIQIEFASEVLIIADILLEDRLKTMAITSIVKSEYVLDYYNIFDILHLGWEMRAEKLEHFAAKHLAKHLIEYQDSADLKQAIIDSSERISSRQETDTVELVDDIRYYLIAIFVTKVQDMLEEEDYDNIEYQKRISIMNDLLNEIGIEA
ncbi:Uncharacterized protein RNJ44_04879 [Nakaseomyces bracarensis]|uniref:BTB domain-containing protein n=1 Tax=Nakaseomyces bracarensis TaxID=273131 RepID=A0ABR4NW85_9SACH